LTYLSRARSLSHIQSRSLPLSRHPFSLFLARALSLSLSLCGHTYVEKARKPLARGLFGKLFAGKRDQKKVKSSHDGSLDAGRGGGDAQQLAALKDGERRYCRFDAAGRAGDDVLESGEVTLNALAPLSHPCVRKPLCQTMFVCAPTIRGAANTCTRKTTDKQTAENTEIRFKKYRVSFRG